jgi:hypothetical protein
MPKLRAMLHDIEQAMWYTNMAAAVVLFARLGAQGLVRAYPVLFAYLFADTLEQIAASVFAQRLNLYAEIYFVGQTVKVALAIFVVLELYGFTLAQQPVVARFGRRMLGYLFSIDIVFGLANLVLEFHGSAGRPRGALLRVMRLERSVDLFAFILLALMAGFWLRFPVRARRNVAVWLGGFLPYRGSRWTGLLLANRFPQLTHELSVAVFAVSLACFIGWSLMLKREGEEEIVVIW